MSKNGKDPQTRSGGGSMGGEQGTTSYGVEQELAQAAEAARVIGFIEAHLFEPLTVARIARACNVSAFHFSRRFAARQGESLMAYVRGRRLETAAQRLKGNDCTSLATLALDCGFESQAAFTRAFTRAFGIAPAAFRRGSSRNFRRRARMKIAPVLEESIEQLSSFTVAGMAARFEPSTYVRTAELWKSFATRLRESGFSAQIDTCGVFRDRDFAAGAFEHLAGIRVEQEATIPPGFASWCVPAGTYLVFKQRLAAGELHPQVAAAQAEIWGQRLPGCGRIYAGSPDFQIYPAQFTVGEGGWIAYYIPVV